MAISTEGGSAGRSRGDDEDVVPDFQLQKDTPKVVRNNCDFNRTLRAENIDHRLVREVAQAIKSVARDLHAHPPRRSFFEQYVYLTKLNQFSRRNRDQEW